MLIANAECCRRYPLEACWFWTSPFPETCLWWRFWCCVAGPQRGGPLRGRTQLGWLVCSCVGQSSGNDGKWLFIENFAPQMAWIFLQLQTNTDSTCSSSTTSLTTFAKNACVSRKMTWKDASKKKPPAKVSDASQKPPKEKAGRRYSKKNSMPFALVGCVQKKNHLLRWVMPPKSLQKRKQGEDTQKKTACILLNFRGTKVSNWRLRRWSEPPKTPHAQSPFVQDAAAAPLAAPAVAAPLAPPGTGHSGSLWNRPRDMGYIRAYMYIRGWKVEPFFFKGFCF